MAMLAAVRSNFQAVLAAAVSSDPVRTMASEQQAASAKIVPVCLPPRDVPRVQSDLESGQKGKKVMLARKNLVVEPKIVTPVANCGKKKEKRERRGRQLGEANQRCNRKFVQLTASSSARPVAPTTVGTVRNDDITAASSLQGVSVTLTQKEAEVCGRRVEGVEQFTRSVKPVILLGNQGVQNKPSWTVHGLQTYGLERAADHPPQRAQSCQDRPAVTACSPPMPCGQEKTAHQSLPGGLESPAVTGCQPTILRRQERTASLPQRGDQKMTEGTTGIPRLSCQDRTTLTACPSKPSCQDRTSATGRHVSKSAAATAHQLQVVGDQKAAVGGPNSRRRTRKPAAEGRMKRRPVRETAAGRHLSGGPGQLADKETRKKERRRSMAGEIMPGHINVDRRLETQPKKRPILQLPAPPTAPPASTVLLVHHSASTPQDEGGFAVLPPPKSLARVEQRFIQFCPDADHVPRSERKPLLVSQKRKPTDEGSQRKSKSWRSSARFQCPQCDEPVPEQLLDEHSCSSARLQGQLECSRCLKLYSSLTDLDRHICDGLINVKTEPTEEVEQEQEEEEEDLCSKVKVEIKEEVEEEEEEMEGGVSSLKGQEDSAGDETDELDDDEEAFLRDPSNHPQDVALESHSSLRCGLCHKNVSAGKALAHLKGCGKYTMDEKGNFSCPHCVRLFAVRSSLERHVHAIHMRRKEKCETCGVRFMNLKSHQDKYHNFRNVDTCTLCGKVVKHLSAHHCPLDQNPRHRRDVNVDCPSCGNLVKQKYLKIHQRSHCVGIKSSTFSNFRTETPSQMRRIRGESLESGSEINYSRLEQGLPTQRQRDEECAEQDTTEVMEQEDRLKDRSRECQDKIQDGSRAKKETTADRRGQNKGKAEERTGHQVKEVLLKPR